MGVLKKFWAGISFALFLVGIYWLPQDMLDWQGAAQPWKRIFSMVDQTTALWVFSIVAATYILWMDMRPFAVRFIKSRNRTNVGHSQIPDLRAADFPALRSMLDGAERIRFVGLLQSGDIKAWSRTVGFENLRPVPADFWLNSSLKFEEIDGQPQTLIAPHGYGRTRPWGKKETAPTLTTYHDVYFNKAELQRLWPEIGL